MTTISRGTNPIGPRQCRSPYRSIRNFKAQSAKRGPNTEALPWLKEKHFSSSSSRDEDFLGFFLGSNEVRFNDHGEKLPTSIDTPDTSVDSRICLNREQGHNRPAPIVYWWRSAPKQRGRRYVQPGGYRRFSSCLDIIARVESLYQKAHRCWDKL